MAYTIGKRMIAYPPYPTPQLGAQQPHLTGAANGIPHTGSVLTCSTGADWLNTPVTYAYQWWVGTHTAYASATNASYSISAGDAGSYLTCALSAFNPTWGTRVQYIATGTAIP